MASNPIGWFEIYVQDLPRAKRFYETVLGVTLNKLPSPIIEMWAFPQNFTSYGSSGALVRAEGIASGGNSTLVYFHSEDCAVEAGRVAAAGGRLLKERFSIGEFGFIALAFDTEGNLFGLHSMK
jgi:hypothetical protein